MNLLIRELRPKRVEIIYTAEGNKTSADIQVDCSPTDSTVLLEIGEKHVFARRTKRPFLAFLGKRRLCDFSINLKRKSEVTTEESEKIGLSNAKIGFLFFFPPEKKDEVGPGSPALLGARVFVSDELHESLRDVLQAGERRKWLRLSLEIEEGGLKYGSEPDGSRMVWKVENENECSHLNVTSLDIRVCRFGPLRSLLLLALGG